MRFATSPLWETVASVRALQKPGGDVHRVWAEPMRERLREAGLDLSRLLMLIPPRGYLADFLTPTPRRRHGDFGAELDLLRASHPALVMHSLRMLRDSATPGHRSLIDVALQDPGTLVERVADDLEAYWELTVSHVADRLEGLAEADITWRLDQIAAGGTHAVLDTLHPRVRMDGSDLLVADLCDWDPAPGVEGVVLVPCAFAWPDLLFLEVPDSPVTLSYSPRGVGTLWRDAPDTAGSPLADLMGRTRASLLVLLDLPMTTAQLACHLDLSPPTTNEHLHILKRAGLVTADRRGRRVLYARTSLGGSLIGDTTEPNQRHEHADPSPRSP